MKTTDKNKEIVLSAIAISLALSSLMIFRGSTSLASALFIPLTIAIFTKNHSNRLFIFTGALLVFSTVALFTTQTVFVLGYMLMGYMLKKAHGKFGFLGYVVATAFLLYIGIRLTELVFLVPIHQMMNRISGGSIFVYGGIVLFESLFVSFVQFGFLRTVDKKIPRHAR